jgi:hypothetical protein
MAVNMRRAKAITFDGSSVRLCERGAGLGRL